MPYCYKCGVKLDDSAKICPLCGTKIPENSDNNKNSKEESSKSMNDKNYLYPSFSESSDKDKVKSILEIISVSFIISIISIVLINYILERNITWSKIPSVTIFFTWIIVCSIFIFLKRILYSFIFIFISVFGFLLSLDSMDKKISWSMNYGLPILLSIVIFAVLLYFIIKISKQKGINILAYFLLSGCGICFCIDIIINFNILKNISISWSKYVSFAVIPISCFLLYIHYRFAKKLPGKRVFRI